MTANINPETGIAYGYIAANSLDSEVIDTLMYGSQAKDLTFEQYKKDLPKLDILKGWDVEIVKNLRTGAYGWIDLGDKDFSLNFLTEEDAIEEALARYGDDLPQSLIDDYQPDEPEIEGEYEGVHYRTSWLGGALNFFIFSSPHITDKARMASPCVPNAGILDTLDGSVTSYDVPADWRNDHDPR